MTQDMRKAMKDITKQEAEINQLINNQLTNYLFINNLIYADDVILIATSKDDLQELVICVQNASKRVGLLKNSAKTKAITSGKNKNKINATLYDQGIRDDRNGSR